MYNINNNNNKQWSWSSSCCGRVLMKVILDWYEGQEKVDLSDYVNSGTWDIIDCPGFINYTFDDVEGHHKTLITFTLRIRRKTLFYTVNLIIPCVLISFLSVCVFYLPADAGEKMTMCISILLALVVFLLLVSKILPPTSITIPLIAKYLLFTFIMNIVTILITVIIINWNFKTPRTHRMPGWIRAVFLNWLPRALLMARPHHMQRSSKKAYSRRNYRPSIGSRFAASGTASSSSPDLMELAEVRRTGAVVKRRAILGPTVTSAREDSTAAAADTDADPSAGGGLPFRLTAETRRAIEAVQFVAAHLKNEDDYAEVTTVQVLNSVGIDLKELGGGGSAAKMFEILARD